MFRRPVKCSWCAVLLVLTATAPAGQSARPREAGRIDGARLVRDVESLSAPEMEGRLSGTPGNKRAQAFIAAQFKEIGLEPLNGAFEQKFAFKQSRVHGRGGARRRQPDGDRPRHGGARPLRPGLGSLRSSRRPQRPGLSRRRRQRLGRGGTAGNGTLVPCTPARQSLLFVAFDAEEEGLQGARHFVAHPPVPLDRITAVAQPGHGRPRRQERHLRRGHPSPIRR